MEVNPRKPVKVITLRSGCVVEMRAEKSPISKKVKLMVVEEEEAKREEIEKPIVKEYCPLIPYPS